jgi:GNAT superfamily N-acetyltransferase
MPHIEIRPATASDIPALVELNPHYVSDHVWQMESTFEKESGEVTTRFRQVHLPRAVQVEYPRSQFYACSVEAQATAAETPCNILVALLADAPIGYTALTLERLPDAAWVTDLVVHTPHRRQGIGSALLLAATEWATQCECRYLVLEMQTKNYPAIQLALKLGFEFCGYNDLYYPGHEIGIFFQKSI